MNEQSVFWKMGYEKGVKCRQHPDKVKQEEWNKNVLFGSWSYLSFLEWDKGYRLSKKENY